MNCSQRRAEKSDCLRRKNINPQSEPSGHYDPIVVEGWPPGRHKIHLITVRACVAMLMLDFWRRAVKEKKYRQATRALQLRIKFLRDLREHRGWEK